MIDIQGQLRAAEETPDWDMQKLRGHVMLLSRHRDYMNDEEARRCQAITERLQRRMKELTGYSFR